MTSQATDKPIPGHTYVLFGGKPNSTWAEREIKADSLPLGAFVSYEDRANPKQIAVIVEAVGTGHNGQRCIFVEDFHEGHVSQVQIDGAGGWQREEGEASADEIAALIAGVAPARAQREREQSERASQHAAEVARLVAELEKKYPWAKKIGTVSGHARAAANLRKELSLAFR